MIKKLLFMLLVLCLLASTAQAALTYGASYYLLNHCQFGNARTGVDPAYLFRNELDTLLGATAGTATASVALILDSDTMIDTLNVGTTGVSFLESSGATHTTTIKAGDQTGALVLTLPIAYATPGHFLTSSGSGVLSWAAAGSGTFTGGAISGDITMADTKRILSHGTATDYAAIEVYDSGAGYINVLRWTDAATPEVLLGHTDASFALVSTGLNVTTAGVVTGVTTLAAESADFSGAAGITLENNGTITNTPDGTFLFTDAGDSFSMAFASTTMTLGISSGDLDTIEFGVLDNLTGIDEITFDAATTSTITKPSAANQDFTISMSGAADASLILSSTGTGADALQISTSTGGITIINGGDAGGEDIHIDAVLASILIDADEDVEDAIFINATAGGINITANGASDKDLDLTCTEGSINIVAGENNASAIVIATTAGTGGTSEAININCDSGTAEDAIDIDAGAGGIALDAVKGIAITSTEGSGDSIVILSTDGGMDITAATNSSEDMDIAVTGTTDSHLIISCTGTSEDAMQLTTTAGGIEILNGGETDGEDLELTSTTESIILNAGEDHASAITLFASNGAGGIDIDCGSGGINIDASAGAFTIIGELPSTLTVASNTDNEDLTISVTGSGNSSLLMTSIGTADDAISLQVSGAGGGIDMDAGADGEINIAGSNDLTITVVGGTNGEDILITNTTTAECSITLENTGGTVSDAIGIYASGTGGGIDIDTDNGAISIVADGASNGTITIDAEDQITIASADTNGGDSILVTATTGVNSDVKIYNVAGTAADAIEIVTGAGGITMTATGGSDGDFLITVGDDFLLDATGLVTIQTSDAGAAGDIKIDADAASILLDSGEDVANAISLICTGGSGGIDITGLGPIDITTTGDTGEDITIANALGSINITSGETAASQIFINATGTIDGTMAIVIDADDGGIRLLADGDTEGDIDLDCEDDMTLTAAGDLTVNVTGTTSFSDKDLTNIGDIQVASISDDADTDVRWLVKTWQATIDVNIADTTLDAGFDATAGNSTAQDVKIGNAVIPAFAHIISFMIVCIETIDTDTSHEDILIKLGTSSGGTEFMTVSGADELDVADDLLATTAAGALIFDPSASALDIWMQGDPDSVDWTIYNDGQWQVYVTYIDLGQLAE